MPKLALWFNTLHLGLALTFGEKHARIARKPLRGEARPDKVGHQPEASLAWSLRIHGIVGNFRAIARFREEARRVWPKWLTRRPQRASMRWDRMQRLLERYLLPRARIRPSPPRAANP